jgi:hypothetical protein
VSSEETDNVRLLNVSIAPPPLGSVEVRYYETTSLSVLITNNAPSAILVEQVVLRFQSDGNAKVYVDQPCGWELQRKRLHEQSVAVCPTPIYLGNTNMFDVMVRFRLIEKGVPQAQRSEVHHGSYLIIREAARNCGKLFISFKQPEDLTLARTMEKLARRAGFDPYVALHNSQPGTDLWKRIEPELRTSDAAAIIWTSFTAWGDGVQREVRLAREFGVPEVLMLEEGLDVPEEYAGSDIEYLRFDRENPAPGFLKMLTARRNLHRTIVRDEKGS